MESAKVSVIVPAYNNAEFLGDTIQSVLTQTYPNFELIIINDASPDHSTEVVRQFDDARIKYIVHEKNQGLSAARNTGIRSSVGGIIALLDGDDIFHPDKLQAHVEFLDENPDVGVTYNSRFELNHSSEMVRGLWRPPLTVSLADLVIGFPFGPSDMVLRRDWVFRVNLFDEYYTYVGEDLDINCRLALAGCKIASIDRALNYRRYHSGRIINIPFSVDNTIRPLNATFSDPRCPSEVLNLQDLAYSTHYLLWSAIAFTQDETALGREYCLEAVQRNPSFLDGTPSQLIDTMILYSIVDESIDHPLLLRRILDQLPPEAAWPADLYDWAVARGYLLRGTRAIMWERLEDGRDHFERAAALNAKTDKVFLSNLSAQLLDYEAIMGYPAAENVIRNLSPYLKDVGEPSELSWLKGNYSINKAFLNYRDGKFANVPKDVFNAVKSDLNYLTNRGMWSILFRSLLGMVNSANR